ncbi:hypothetical protein V8C43DRAFT_33277 [Trichoderma afarasin]
MHGRFVWYWYLFFSLSFYLFIGGGFWAKRAEREEDKKKKRELQKSYCFTYIHILIFGGNGNPSFLGHSSYLSCIYIQKSFWFPFVGNCFFLLRFFLSGVSYYSFFCGFFLLLMPPFHSKID